MNVIFKQISNADQITEAIEDGKLLYNYESGKIFLDRNSARTEFYPNVIAPTFTEASTLANVVSGESQATLWGKVKKFFTFIGTTTISTFATTISSAINEISKIVIGTTLTYSASSTYVLGAYTLYQGNLYRCITAITVGEPFNATKWAIVSIISDLLVTRTASVKVVKYTITNQAVGSGQVYLIQNLQALLATGQTIKGYTCTITNSTNTNYIKSVFNYNDGIILEMSNADIISAKVYVYYV